MRVLHARREAGRALSEQRDGAASAHGVADVTNSAGRLAAHLRGIGKTALRADRAMGLLDFAVFSVAFLPLAVRVGELGLDGLILDIGYLLDWRWWACVGGIGIAPGGNINYNTGHAIFEATHGTAPKYAGLDKVNPGSVILSGEMMLRHLGWNEAADLIVKGIGGAISAKTVTYDFERLMDGATKLGSREFGDAIIRHM